MRSAVGTITEAEQVRTLARVHAIHERIKHDAQGLSLRIDELLA